MPFLGRGGVLYYIGVVTVSFLMAAIMILLIVNLVLWATLFQVNILAILSNVFYFAGIVLSFVLLGLVFWNSNLNFGPFLAQYWVFNVFITLYGIILTGLMIPVWIFLFMYWANDFDNLTTVRVGAVAADSINLFVRAPGSFATVGLAVAGSSSSGGFTKRQIDLTQFAIVNQGSSFPVLAGTDSTISFRISNLSANSVYQITPTVRSSLGLQQLRTVSVRTAPSQDAAVTYSFIFGSCIHKGWTDFRGFRRMTQLNPTFLLFLGDFIYIENPFDQGRSVGDYNKRYRRHLDDPSARKFLERTPSFFMFDDHEIFNDFPGTEFDGKEYHNGILVSWQNYIGLANPTPRVPFTFYYNYTYGNTAFFVVDTRTFRDKDTGTMLGQEQKLQLFQWLLDTNGLFPFRFIASSVSFSAENGDDSWTAFRSERNQIINFMIANQINGVILLSGDLHYAMVSQIIPGLYEFSASPIDAFPFFATGDIDGKKLFTRTGHRNIGRFVVDTTNLFVEGQIFDLTFGAPPKYRLKLAQNQLILSGNGFLPV